MDTIYKILLLLLLNQISFASENDSIKLYIAIDTSLYYEKIIIKGNNFEISKEVNKSKIQIKIPSFKEPNSAFILFEGETVNYTSVVLNDYDLHLHFLTDTIWFEDIENQKLSEYLTDRKKIRTTTNPEFLKQAEDSLVIYFINKNPNLFSALEMLEVLFVQSNFEKEDLQLLFNKFQDEKLVSYSIYERIKWKLENIDNRLGEGSELNGKKIKVFNHKGIPYFLNSIVSREKPTIFVICAKSCYACNRDFIYINENKAKIDSAYHIKYISIEENHETALQHIEANQRQNYYYITDGFLSEFVFLLNITKTPSYIEVTPNSIISNLDFNIRYLENEVPDFPFTIEREEKLKSFRLYHETDAIEISNLEEFEEITKMWKDNKLSSIKITSSADTTGNKIYNKTLSEKRANFVAKSLKEKGIQADKILIVGIGEVNENSLEESRVTKIDIVQNQKHEFKPLETIHFLKIFFQGAVSNVIPESKPYLNKLLKIMKENPSLKIKITGHICCNIGEGEGVDFNTNEKNLSWARARVIKDFLIENGIDETRLEIEGMAHKKPRYKGGPEIEKYNRRVEIVVLDY